VEIDTALTSYLDDITDKVIREEVHGGARDAEEIAEPRTIANSGGAAVPAHPRVRCNGGSAGVRYLCAVTLMGTRLCRASHSLAESWWT
jgi:hypothetical protein